MPKLYLLRHGQTDWNLEGRYQGQTDIPLNDTGKEQAEFVSKQLENEKISAVYSSDLSRARETAKAVAKKHNLEVIEIPELKEINQGTWEGMLYEDIKKKYAKELKERKIDPMNIAPPGGETVREFKKRILSGFNSIIEKHNNNETIAIVSHGFTTAVAKTHFLNLDIQDVWDNVPHNTDITVIDL